MPAEKSQEKEAKIRTTDRFFALGVGGVLVIASEVFQGTSLLPDDWVRPFLDPNSLETLWPEAAKWGSLLCIVSTAVLLHLENHHYHQLFV